MALDVSSVPDTTASLEPLERIDAYERWQQAEGAPVIGGFYIEDLNTVQLGPWPRKGDSITGAFINLDGTGGVNDMHLVDNTMWRWNWSPPAAPRRPIATCTRQWSTYSPAAGQLRSGTTRAANRTSNGARAASLPYRSTPPIASSTARVSNQHVMSR